MITANELADKVLLSEEAAHTKQSQLDPKLLAPIIGAVSGGGLGYLTGRKPSLGRTLGGAVLGGAVGGFAGSGAAKKLYARLNTPELRSKAKDVVSIARGKSRMPNVGTTVSKLPEGILENMPTRDHITNALAAYTGLAPTRVNPLARVGGAVGEGVGSVIPASASKLRRILMGEGGGVGAVRKVLEGTELLGGAKTKELLKALDATTEAAGSGLTSYTMGPKLKAPKGPARVGVQPMPTKLRSPGARTAKGVSLSIARGATVNKQMFLKAIESLMEDGLSRPQAAKIVYKQLSNAPSKAIGRSAGKWGGRLAGPLMLALMAAKRTPKLKTR